MPNARRVIYSSYALPTSTERRDEGVTSPTDDDGFTMTALNTSGGLKRFTGKGTVDILANQGTDTWTSMEHANKTWESYAHNEDVGGDYWDDRSSPWGEFLSVGIGSATVLRPSPHSANIVFLYIRNVGAGNTATLSLNNIGYDILIPIGAAVSMRVNSIASANIKVDSIGTTWGDETTWEDSTFDYNGSATIEYIIAKAS